MLIYKINYSSAIVRGPARPGPARPGLFMNLTGPARPGPARGLPGPCRGLEGSNRSGCYDAGCSRNRMYSENLPRLHSIAQRSGSTLHFQTFNINSMA